MSSGWSWKGERTFPRWRTQLSSLVKPVQEDISESDLTWHLFHVERGRWAALVSTFSRLLTTQSALNYGSHSLIHTPSRTQPSGGRMMCYLSQGDVSTWTEGAGNWTADVPISELQPKRTRTQKYESMSPNTVISHSLQTLNTQPVFIGSLLNMRCEKKSLMTHEKHMTHDIMGHMT